MNWFLVISSIEVESSHLSFIREKLNLFRKRFTHNYINHTKFVLQRLQVLWYVSPLMVSRNQELIGILSVYLVISLLPLIVQMSSCTERPTSKDVQSKR